MNFSFPAAVDLRGGGSGAGPLSRLALDRRRPTAKIKN
jgi:hypothetical protein